MSSIPSQPPITSLQNQRIKDAIKLRDRRERERQGRFVIDGAREIQHALAAREPSTAKGLRQVEFVEAFVCPDFCADTDAVMNKLAATGAEVATVSTAVWEKLTFGQRRDGYLVIARPPARKLAEFEPGAQARIVILEAIEKPGNVGAVIRTADAAGFTGVLVMEPVSDLYNPNTIRSSLGTLFRLPVIACSNADARAWLTEKDIQPFAAIVGAKTSYTDANFSGSCAIVMGSEADGLSASWRDEEMIGVSLPMHGFADSLNISTSAAILMYEVLRQSSSGS